MKAAYPILALFVLLPFFLANMWSPEQTDVYDEAKAAGKTPGDFPAAGYDYFRDMDMVVAWEKGKDEKRTLKPLDLDADEIKGRNTWMMWCGGDEAFWDWLAGHSYGFLDLLKLVASPDHQAGVLKRQRRFTDAGLINEPGCQTAAAQDEFGLFLEPPKDPLTPKPHEE